MDPSRAVASSQTGRSVDAESSLWGALVCLVLAIALALWGALLAWAGDSSQQLQGVWCLLAAAATFIGALGGLPSSEDVRSRDQASMGSLGAIALAGWMVLACAVVLGFWDAAWTVFAVGQAGSTGALLWFWNAE